jgi:hypothetical protein
VLPFYLIVAATGVELRRRAALQPRRPAAAVPIEERA